MREKLAAAGLEVRDYTGQGIWAVIVSPVNINRKGMLSTVYLQTKVAYFVKSKYLLRF